MTRIFLLLVFAGHFTAAKAQAVSPTVDSVYLYTQVNEVPEPVKGVGDLYMRLSRQMKYPETEQGKKPEGTVHLYVIVDKAGNVTESGIEKGISKALDDEILAAYRRCNIAWKAGKKNGLPVVVKRVFPIHFKNK